MEIKKHNIKVNINLPIEEGKTYKTKLQTGESFKVNRISQNKRKVFGIWEACPHLGECPLDIERLLPEFIIDLVEMDVCTCCNTPIECKTCKTNSEE